MTGGRPRKTLLPPQPRSPEQMLQLASETFKTTSEAMSLQIETLMKTVQASNEAIKEALTVFQDSVTFLREQTSDNEKQEQRLVQEISALLKVTTILRQLPPGSARVRES